MRLSSMHNDSFHRWLAHYSGANEHCCLGSVLIEKAHADVHAENGGHKEVWKVPESSRPWTEWQASRSS